MPYMKGVECAIAEDLTGSKFNRLSVVSRNYERRRVSWNCVCECGNHRVVASCDLKNGHTKSCGCLSRENTSTRSKTHGATGTPTYITLFHMLERCRNPKVKDYKRYGGRGISVCQRWNSFECFLQDMGEKPDGLTLDRIDVNGNYEPGNCRWATQEQQQNNRRNNAYVELNGQRMTITKAGRALGKHHSSIAWAIKKYGDAWLHHITAAAEQQQAKETKE